MDDDDILQCPNCEANMELLIATKDPLYRCRACGLEQYESAVTDYWVKTTVEEFFDGAKGIVAEMLGTDDPHAPGGIGYDGAPGPGPGE